MAIKLRMKVYVLHSKALPTLTKQSFRVAPVKKEFKLHMETNEALDMAYDDITCVLFLVVLYAL